MRIELKLSPNTDPVPFDHLHKFTGVFHRWAGDGNDLHEGPSLYSVSWLRGGDVADGALTFPRGAEWELSFYDDEVAARVHQNISRQADTAYGMRVLKAEIEPTPSLGGMYRFTVGSPVLTRRQRENGGRDHLLHDDPEADATLTRTLRHKMEVAGCSATDREVMVGFDRSYDKPKTKLVHYKNVNFKGSICPVIVAGTPTAVQFAYDVGVGELTGCGFGFLEMA